MADKSNLETSRTTVNNPVSIVKASNPPVPKKKSLPKKSAKPDSIIIKTANLNGSLSKSGDEDQKECEEMLASPVKGSDAQTASTVSPNNAVTIFFHCSILVTIVPLELSFSL